MAVDKRRKCLYISSAKTLRKTTRPVYNKICLNSVALYLSFSANARGLRENSLDIYGRSDKSFSEICRTDLADSLQSSGPFSHANMAYMAYKILK